MLLNRMGVRSGARKLCATLGSCCLLMLVAGPAGAEFRLLDSLQETKIERIEKFVAAEAFKIGSRIGGKTLSAVGLNFAQHFLGVVEKDVPAISLSAWALRYTTGDRSLIKAFGGEQDVAVLFLAYIHAMMEMGDAGVGHTDWRSNFAYVRSPIDQRLWAVHWTVNYANEWNIGPSMSRTKNSTGALAHACSRAGAGHKRSSWADPMSAPNPNTACPSLGDPCSHVCSCAFWSVSSHCSQGA